MEGTTNLPKKVEVINPYTFDVTCNACGTSFQETAPDRREDEAKTNAQFAAEIRHKCELSKNPTFTLKLIK